jgi:hypothetical protein
LLSQACHEIHVAWPSSYPRCLSCQDGRPDNGGNGGWVA